MQGGKSRIWLRSRRLPSPVLRLYKRSFTAEISKTPNYRLNTGLWLDKSLDKLTQDTFTLERCFVILAARTRTLAFSENYFLALTTNLRIDSAAGV